MLAACPSQILCPLAVHCTFLQTSLAVCRLSPLLGPALQVVMGLPAADAVELVSNGTVDAAVLDGQALNMLGTSQQAQVSNFTILDGVSPLPARAVSQLAGCCLASAG